MNDERNEKVAYLAMDSTNSETKKFVKLENKKHQGQQLSDV